MIKNHNLWKRFLLPSIAILTCIAVVVVYRFNDNNKEIYHSELLLPELSAARDDITKIKLSQGESSLEFVFDSDSEEWLLPSRNLYPADRNMVSKLLYSLTTSTLEERKTGLRSMYHTLGLDEKSAMNIQLHDKDNNIISDLFIGKKRQIGRGVYARLQGDRQTWVVSDIDIIGNSPNEWLNKNIYSIDSRRIRSIFIERTGHDSIALIRTSTNHDNFSLVNIPTDALISSQSNINDYANGFRKILITDVFSINDQMYQTKISDDPDIKVRVQTFDGLEIRLSMYQSGDEVTYLATVEPKLIESLISDSMSSNEYDKSGNYDENSANKDEATSQFSEDINDSTNVYEKDISSYDENYSIHTEKLVIGEQDNTDEVIASDNLTSDVVSIKQDALLSREDLLLSFSILKRRTEGRIFEVNGFYGQLIADGIDRLSVEDPLIEENN